MVACSTTWLAAQNYVDVSCCSTATVGNGNAASRVRNHRCVRAHKDAEIAGPAPTQTRWHGTQTFQRGCGDSCTPIVRCSCPCCRDRRKSEAPTSSGAWQRWRPGRLLAGNVKHRRRTRACPTVWTSQWSGHGSLQIASCCAWQRCRTQRLCKKYPESVT